MESVVWRLLLMLYSTLRRRERADLNKITDRWKTRHHAPTSLQRDAYRTLPRARRAPLSPPACPTYCVQRGAEVCERHCGGETEDIPIRQFKYKSFCSSVNTRQRTDTVRQYSNGALRG